VGLTSYAVGLLAVCPDVHYTLCRQPCTAVGSDAFEEIVGGFVSLSFGTKRLSKVRFNTLQGHPLFGTKGGGRGLVYGWPLLLPLMESSSF
jgi:hypothetical protein